ncbi:MAG TPA: hypothetical protein VGG74_11810 [Kofleriaceae bacterium]|jgi:hypothetical protein
MSKQSWMELLQASEVDGSALASSTAATTLLPSHAKLTLPQGFFDAPGKQIRVTLAGRISTLNPTPGNLTLSLQLGPTSAIGAASSGSMALNTTATKTNVAWWAELLATCRAVGGGTNANLMFQWKVYSEAFALATTGVGMIFGPASAPAVGTGFDSTSAQLVDIFGQWSVSSASNSITLHQFCFEALN